MKLVVLLLSSMIFAFGCTSQRQAVEVSRTPAEDNPDEINMGSNVPDLGPGQDQRRTSPDVTPVGPDDQSPDSQSPDNQTNPDQNLGGQNNGNGITPNGNNTVPTTPGSNINRNDDRGQTGGFDVNLDASTLQAAASYTLDLNNLKWRLDYANRKFPTAGREDIDFNNDRAQLKVQGLPTGTTSDLILRIYEGDKEVLWGTSRGVRLQSGSNRIELTIRPVGDTDANLNINIGIDGGDNDGDDNNSNDNDRNRPDQRAAELIKDWDGLSMKSYANVKLNALPTQQDDSGDDDSGDDNNDRQAPNLATANLSLADGSKLADHFEEKDYIVLDISQANCGYCMTMARRIQNGQYDDLTSGNCSMATLVPNVSRWNQYLRGGGLRNDDHAYGVSGGLFQAAGQLGARQFQGTPHIVVLDRQGKVVAERSGGMPSNIQQICR